jgi:hypothetical protein
MRIRRQLLSAAFVALAATAIHAPAHAQALGRMLACADVPRAEERLQCYDAAARGAIGVGAQSASAADPRLAAREAEIQDLQARIRELESAKLAKPVKASPAAVSGADTGQAAGVAAGLAEREAALAAREADLKSREAQLAAVKPEMSAAEEATLFGIPIPFTKKDRFNQIEDLPNQKVERNEDGVVEALIANVAEFSYAADERLILVLENGQVWRQTEGDRINLKSDPEKPHVVRISRGAVGSFNLKVNESNRTVKVRRVDGVKGKR